MSRVRKDHNQDAATSGKQLGRVNKKNGRWTGAKDAPRGRTASLQNRTGRVSPQDEKKKKNAHQSWPAASSQHNEKQRVANYVKEAKKKMWERAHSWREKGEDGRHYNKTIGRDATRYRGGKRTFGVL